MRSKLAHLELEGYKSFTPKQTIRFGDITIFIGANGAGKSNLISLFRLLGYLSTGNFQGFVSQGGDAATFTHPGDLRNTIQIMLEISNETHENGYEITLAPTEDNKLRIRSKQFITKKLPDRIPRKEMVSDFTPESILLKEGYVEKNPVNIRLVSSIIRNIRYYQIHDTSSNSNMKKDSEINASRSLYTDGGNLSAILYGLKTNPEYFPYYQRIIENIQLACPSFKDFQLKPNLSNNRFNRLNFQDQSSPLDHAFGPH